jgi:hypothetical protein
VPCCRNPLWLLLLLLWWRWLHTGWLLLRPRLALALRGLLLLLLELLLRPCEQ